jgi:hypothetical protein
MPIDFSKGKIYKIVNVEDSEVYVGSTCQPLSRRMGNHRKSCYSKIKKNRKLYKHMRDIGIENFHIYLVEDCPCSNKEELRKREGYWIRKIGTLNSCIAGRSKAEYYQDNCEKIKAQNRENQKKNPEKKKEMDRKYYEKNSEKIKANVRKYHKENYAVIKEKRKEYFQNYRKENREKLKETVECEICGFVGRKTNITRHQKSKKCQSFI